MYDISYNGWTLYVSSYFLWYSTSRTVIIALQLKLMLKGFIVAVLGTLLIQKWMKFEDKTNKKQSTWNVCYQAPRNGNNND